MLVYIIGAVAVGGLGVACVYFSVVAQNVRGMNADAEALWPENDASWRGRNARWWG